MHKSGVYIAYAELHQPVDIIRGGLFIFPIITYVMGPFSHHGSCLYLYSYYMFTCRVLVHRSAVLTNGALPQAFYAILTCPNTFLQLHSILSPSHFLNCKNLPTCLLPQLQLSCLPLNKTHIPPDSNQNKIK